MRANLRMLCAAISLCLAMLGNPTNLTAFSFGPGTSYPVGTNPVAVVVGDFNGDGKLDLAVANSGSNFVSILLGNGDGTFRAALMADAGGPQTSIAVGDFNGDGKLDLVVNSGPGAAGATHGVSILLGNGDGTFRPPVQIQSCLNRVQVAVGDFNLDHKLDVVILEPQLTATDPAPFLNILLGKGDGTFQPPTTIGLAGSSAGSVAVADFNGDGKPDVAAETGNNLSILLGNGDGTFQSARVTTTALAFGSPVLVRDFNGDGKPDVLTRVESSTQICIHGICHNVIDVDLLLGNGDGTFQPSLTVDSSDSTGIAAGDVNVDGKLDFAAFNSGFTTIFLHLGKGDGTFPVRTLINPSFGTSAAAIADVNGDNLPDLILADSTGNNINILLNTSQASGADLSVSFSSAPNSVMQGQNAAFTVRTTNFGPQEATGVVLTADLPANTTLVSAVPTQGTCNAVQLTITCALGPMPSPSVADTTITLTPTVPGMDTISARVAANEQDLSPADNMASATFTVTPIFTLRVMKAGAGGGTVLDNTSTINCGTTCSHTYSGGTNVDLFAHPDSTSAFVSWSGGCTGTDPSSCSIVMNSDMTVTGTFVPAMPLTVSIAGAGTVTSAPPGINCAGSNCTANFTTGSTVNLTANASSGSSFTSWSGACSGTNPNACAVTMNAAQSVTAKFSPPPDFTINPATSDLTVSRGGQGTDVLNFPAQGGFSGTIALACSVAGASPKPTCGIAPQSVIPGNTATLTINAGALSATAALLPFERAGGFHAAWLPMGMIAGVLAICFDKKRRGRWLLCFVLLVATILPVACGGGSSQTTSQTFTITVTATSGAIQHSTPILVTVQ